MGNEEVQRCYSVEDDDEALACLKKVVKEDSGSCKPKLVLLTQDSCSPCKEERELHAEDIAAGIIKEVSVDSPEGMIIAMKNEIDIFPSLILVDCNDAIINPDRVDD